jgi:hypothetical protein
MRACPRSSRCVSAVAAAGTARGFFPRVGIGAFYNRIVRPALFVIAFGVALAGACGGTDLEFVSYTHEDIGELTNLQISDSFVYAESTSDNITTLRWNGTMTGAGRTAFTDATSTADSGWDPSAYGCPSCNTFERLVFRDNGQDVTVDFSPAHVPDELLPLVTHSHELVDAFMRCRPTELMVQDQVTCR